MTRWILLMAVLFVWSMAKLSEAHDPVAGQELSVVCSGCHGVYGHSEDLAMPSLNGQRDRYFIAQMKAYREGARKHEEMEAIARELTDEDIGNLAAYYAIQHPMEALGDPEKAEKGKALYELQKCDECHGKDGNGRGFNPRVKGQHPIYTLLQLKAYKDGTRVNSRMNSVADRLSEEEMEALAEYMAVMK